jgi:hypothetical protein
VCHLRIVRSSSKGTVEYTMIQINYKKKIRKDEPSSRFACAEVQKNLPQDLLPKVTVLLQHSGYVTISPRVLTRADWNRINEKVRLMGGLWVSNERYNHWSIPFSRTR